MPNTSSDIALFQISLKALIVKNQAVLTLISKDGFFDFPGGRINNDEIKMEFSASLNREISEELSENFKFRVENFAFAAKRVFRIDKSNNDVLALFFNVTALNEDIKLSDEHQEYQWLKVQDLLAQPERFVSIDEFNKLKDYLIIAKISYNN